jgi:Flp pilus assembly protein CpaB
MNNVVVFSLTALLIAFGVLGMVVADLIMHIQQAQAQQEYR